VSDLTARYQDGTIDIYEHKPKVWTQDAIDEYVRTHEPHRVSYYSEWVALGEQDVTYPCYANDGSLFRSPTVTKYIHTTETVGEMRNWKVSYWKIPGGGTVAYKERVE
jgi:hypothetical protein